MYKDLDPILHSQLRLAIVSILMTNEEVDFNYVKGITQATSGNISIQIKKLQDAGYIEVIKSFKNNYQNTTLKITNKGIKAFEQYIEDLKSYLNTNH
jgi:DNA-binding MarR family transcriptional regulator